MAVKSRLPLGSNRQAGGRADRGRTDTPLARFGPNDSISLIGAGRAEQRPKAQSPKTDGRHSQREPFLQTGFGFRQRRREREAGRRISTRGISEIQAAHGRLQSSSILDW